MPLSRKVLELYNDPHAIKILAVASRENELHLILATSMMAPDPETIIFAIVDTADINKNLVQAMTSRELVSVLAVAMTEKILPACQIRCIVKEFQTTGPLYDKFLDQLKAYSEELEGVWILKSVEIIDRTPGLRSGKQIS